MSYKSSNFRRGQDHANAPAERGNAKVHQLQEMFPSWSDDDLKSLLSEVNYDLELAVTRISEGHAEQWGAVSRKKDKRATPASAVPTNSERGGSRGARGGRGGARGGRGGGRGAGRGGHRETNGRHAPSPVPQSSSSWAQDAPTPAAAASDAATSGDRANVNGASDLAATSGWGDSGDASSSADAPSSTPNWGKPDATPSAWGNGAAATPTEPRSQAPTPVAKPAIKTPATSKMSWAQIAKPQEKPKVVPAPAPTQPSAAAAAPTPALASVSEPVATPESEAQPQHEAQGWEEPTTAQAPTWDDEPQVKATSDGWITSVTNQAESQVEPGPVEAVEPSPPKQPEPEQIPVPSVFPAQLGLHQKTDSPVGPPVKPSTPVSYARSLNSRVGNRFKVTDQAVVMPSTFGSSVEKLGMQFGSVNISGDDVEVDASESPVPEPPAAAAPSVPEPARESQQQLTHAPPPEPAPASTTQTPLIATQSLFQQALPQQAQAQHAQPQIHSSLQSTQQTPPSLLPTQPSAQSTVSSQTAASTATSTPLTSFSAQQSTPSSQSSISPYQQHSSQQQTQAPQPQAPAQNHIQQQQQQQQSQLHQQFSHFPSHLDQAASQQSPPQSQQPQPQQQQTSLHQGIGSHGSYYRQPEQNFHHAPTPPAGQAQEAPYGSFAPLSQQLGYQTQNSHLSGFSSDHFGYNDTSRGFYDSYGQQSGFGGRNALGHDDIGKSLPGGQQASQSGAGLPPSTSQSAQQQTSQQPQGAAQPQAPAAGQPQQGYAPVPFYYNMYQPGQYYGPPYGSGYGLGQYANRYPQQQPPMFQPANPTSASPANAKGPNSVQPQSNPYAPGLYGQQHASSAYDDGYGHHNQLGPQHSQGVGALPANDYGKPLYGGQGIQAFIGQSSTPTAQLGQRGAPSGGSPENSYKPYGPGVGVGTKDVGGAPGVGSGMAGGQGALGQGARAGVQQPQHSQFSYGANRFSSNPSAGGPTAQQAQQQQQQSQGYPQGAGDNAFYYQRPSQNGPPYWG